MTVEEFIQKRGKKVRANRGGWISCCLFPEHRDSTPSFHLSWEGLFYCWGCNKKGSFATLLHDIEGWSWKKAIQHADVLNKANKSLGISRPPVAPEEIRLSRGLLALFEANWREGYARWQVAQSEGDEHRPAWTFPFEKGLLPETLERFQAGYDEEAARVTIPIFDGKIFRGIIGRSCTGAFPKYYIYPPVRSSLYLYNEEAVKVGHDTVILVEGAWDVWMLEQKGITIPAISLLTSQVSPTQIRKLAKLNRTYVLMFDADKAGRKGAREVAASLLAMGLKIDIGMQYPNKDISDIKKMTAGDLMVALKNRKPFPAPSAHALLTQ